VRYPQIRALRALLSTPSLGITFRIIDGGGLSDKLKLSTPSLGITVIQRLISESELSTPSLEDPVASAYLV
jgi:hypothetical protein